nr:restriction endonuclease subunit S [Pseudoscardovia suis]
MVYRDDQSRDIKFKTDNLSSYKLVRAGDFVISLRSFQGGFELSDKTGIVSPAYTVFTHAECSSQDNAYWKQYFKRKSFIESLKTVTFGIRDGKTISFSDFSSLKCIFPSLPEQRRIGEFFTTLDNLIAATEERTRALKEMKSAYLQRMFV